MPVVDTVRERRIAKRINLTRQCAALTRKREAVTNKCASVIDEEDKSKLSKLDFHIKDTLRALQALDVGR